MGSSDGQLSASYLMASCQNTQVKGLIHNKIETRHKINLTIQSNIGWRDDWWGSFTTYGIDEINQNQIPQIECKWYLTREATDCQEA